MKAEKRKGSRKGGLLRCFQAPVVADLRVQEEEESRETSSLDAFLSLPAGPTPSCSSRSSLPDEERKSQRGESSGKRKRLSTRLLAKILRSAVFVTSLQKARSGKACRVTKQVPPPEASSQPLGASGRASDEDGPSSEAGFSSSSLSSSFSSSGTSAFSTITTSCHPPPLAHTEKAPEGEKVPAPPREERTHAGDPASTGLWLVVLLVLFVLVFWGRLCAIFWTSACLCLVLGREWSEGTAERKGLRPGPPAGSSSRRKGAAEEWDKRRVVLAGLLDRRRRP